MTRLYSIYATALFVTLSMLLMTGCSSTQRIKDGMTAYQYKKYSKAIGLLKSEFQESQREDVQAEKAFYLAESYIKLNNYVKANEWYEVSDRLGFGASALNGLAETYKNLEQYDQAIQAFQRLSRLIPGDVSIKSKIFMCEEAKRWKAEEKDNFSFRKLNQNTNYSEYSPALYEGEWLVFTSDNEDASGSSRYDWTGNKKSDLFIMPKRGGTVQSFDGLINTKNNEGTAIFTKDYNTMYFTRCFNAELEGDDYCKLMVSNRTQGVWTEAHPLPFVKNNINYGQPALIENDSVLVFSSISEDQANGFDLWYTVMENNSWSVPYPMPSSINTQGNEYFPTSDGDTLYFSSDQLPGLGGLDIFKTYLKSDGSWAKPVNVRPPLNSGADDFGLIIDRNDPIERNIEYKGYLSSNRTKEGHEDLFYFEKYSLDKEGPIDEKEIVENKQKPTINLYLAGKVLENIFTIEEDPNSDILRQKPIPNPYINITNQNGKELPVSANNNGLFIGNLNLENTYTIIAKKRGYLNQKITLDPKTYPIPDEAKNYTINLEIILEKIYVGKEIVLENIYYDFNESFIRNDAKPTLNALAQKLLDNPQINIELSSHTDCRGGDEFNQNLSQKRAESAVEYLISQGVEANQISAKGYGKSQLINDCPCEACSEEDHQQNRRTTFKIL